MTLHGTNNHWAKLKPDEVRAIRREYDEAVASGESDYAIKQRLGAKYGKAPNTIYYIGKRRTWRSLEEDDETDAGSEGSRMSLPSK